MRKLFSVTLLLLALTAYSQGPHEQNRPVTITGTVLDEETQEPLEYATLVLQSVNDPSKVTGGITDATGKFEVEADRGNYNLSVEYISYKSYKVPNYYLSEDTDLGVIRLSMDVAQLAEVEVVGERTTVELRLDKKVYNVGSDLTVKGGSVTDVLGNVPSVSVDVEGNISLRGNESVRILINGKPSALSGLSPEALQQLPSDAIERVEVITNPSARYDAEGTAGILNIILKQSKTAGLNGSVNVYAGHPENYGGAVSLNLRRDNFNIFTNTTYRYRNGPGNALFNQENFDSNGNTLSFQDEIRDYQRQDKSFNTNIGFELFLDESSSITNSFVFGKSNGDNTVNVDFFNFDADRTPTIERNRFTVEDQFREEVKYSLNYQKKFDKDGHELTFDYQFSKGTNDEASLIEEVILGENIDLDTERTINDETQVSQLVQMDYVLPFGKDNQSQFEIGYRGTFSNNNTDFDFGIQQLDGSFPSDPNFSNELNYKEYINAAYTQLGTKIDKFSILAGLRVEASDIGIELVNTNEITNKDYVNWFPSVFLGYEFSETEQITLSYSKRLRRPWSRFINPFPSRSSNTNLFQGNPDLDPTFTDAYDLGYLKRWDKMSFTTSGYYNRSTGVFQFVSRETGDFVSIDNPDDPNNPIIVPVQVRSPINLATEERYGMEFTTTYTPFRNWRLSWNLNAFQRDLKGDYTYVNSNNETIVQNFDANDFSWFTRFSAKLPLPGKIDFQTNFFYMGPSKDAQSTRDGMLSSDLALSKDILKDKGSISLNVSDIFNTRKRTSTTRTENVLTYSEFQWRERQITLSFQYRFNQPQTQKSRDRRPGTNGGGEEMDFEG
ncbi:outer membrane beta-barrel family protein [Arenibacter latericius]|uniref:outer membrane beta-barrel family protein n=1 Tax=Arenibacter latericius TaxID=86104 RepID=UPI0004070A6E|nr:outer membrane beta-barrel family protein [Arenibacter latericius]